MFKPTSQSLPDQDVLNKIADLFRERSGWKMSGRDWNKFTTAINARMNFHKIDNVMAYYNKLIMSAAGQTEEFFQLASLMANHETYFFRDKGHFTALKTIILPELIQLRRSSKILRIWSAGCSTGEEPYSLAMLIRSLLPDFIQWRITILGSDISLEAIEKARKGLYRENSLRDIELKDRPLYFSKQGNEWLLDAKFRQMVRFFQGNLVEDMFPSMLSEFNHLDLIICRNVFIYFHHTAISKVVEKFLKCLNPGGVMLFGHGEVQIHSTPEVKTQLIQGALIHKKLDIK